MDVIDRKTVVIMKFNLNKMKIFQSRIELTKYFIRSRLMPQQNVYFT